LGWYATSAIDTTFTDNAERFLSVLGTPSPSSAHVGAGRARDPPLSGFLLIPLEWDFREKCSSGILRCLFGGNALSWPRTAVSSAERLYCPMTMVLATKSALWVLKSLVIVILFY
jgi:hypothetical protein